jgi:hypothetical protein
MEADQSASAIRALCKKAYGPLTVIAWSSNRWGVIDAALLDCHEVRHQLLNRTPEDCIKLLMATKTTGTGLVRSLPAVLLLVAAILQEKIRVNREQAIELQAARRQALDDLWSILDDTEPEEPHVRPITRRKRGVQQRL